MLFCVPDTLCAIVIILSTLVTTFSARMSLERCLKLEETIDASLSSSSSSSHFSHEVHLKKDDLLIDQTKINRTTSHNQILISGCILSTW